MKLDSVRTGEAMEEDEIEEFGWGCFVGSREPPNHCRDGSQPYGNGVMVKNASLVAKFPDLSTWKADEVGTVLPQIACANLAHQDVAHISDSPQLEPLYFKYIVSSFVVQGSLVFAGLVNGAVEVKNYVTGERIAMLQPQHHDPVQFMQIAEEQLLVGNRRELSLHDVTVDFEPMPCSGAKQGLASDGLKSEEILFGDRIATFAAGATFEGLVDCVCFDSNHGVFIASSHKQESDDSSDIVVPYTSQLSLYGVDGIQIREYKTLVQEGMEKMIYDNNELLHDEVTHFRVRAMHVADQSLYTAANKVNDEGMDFREGRQVIRWDIATGAIITRFGNHFMDNSIDGKRIPKDSAHFLAGASFLTTDFLLWDFPTGHSLCTVCTMPDMSLEKKNTVMAMGNKKRRLFCDMLATSWGKEVAKVLGSHLRQNAWGDSSDDDLESIKEKMATRDICQEEKEWRERQNEINLYYGVEDVSDLWFGTLDRGILKEKYCSLLRSAIDNKRSVADQRWNGKIPHVLAVEIWDVETGQVTKQLDLGPAFLIDPRNLASVQQSTKCMCATEEFVFVASGIHVVTASHMESMCVWDNGTPHERGERRELLTWQQSKGDDGSIHVGNREHAKMMPCPMIHQWSIATGQVLRNFTFGSCFLTSGKSVICVKEEQGTLAQLETALLDFRGKEAPETKLVLEVRRSRTDPNTSAKDLLTLAKALDEQLRALVVAVNHSPDIAHGVAAVTNSTFDAAKAKSQADALVSHAKAVHLLRKVLKDQFASQIGLEKFVSLQEAQTCQYSTVGHECATALDELIDAQTAKIREEAVAKAAAHEAACPAANRAPSGDYQCDFCNERFPSFAIAEEHETRCTQNPVNMVPEDMPEEYSMLTSLKQARAAMREYNSAKAIMAAIDFRHLEYVDNHIAKGDDVVSLQATASTLYASTEAQSFCSWKIAGDEIAASDCKGEHTERVVVDVALNDVAVLYTLLGSGEVLIRDATTGEVKHNPHWPSIHWHTQKWSEMRVALSQDPPDVDFDPDVKRLAADQRSKSMSGKSLAAVTLNEERNQLSGWDRPDHFKTCQLDISERGDEMQFDCWLVQDHEPLSEPPAAACDQVKIKDFQWSSMGWLALLKSASDRLNMEDTPLVLLDVATLQHKATFPATKRISSFAVHESTIISCVVTGYYHSEEVAAALWDIETQAELIVFEYPVHLYPKTNLGSTVRQIELREDAHHLYDDLVEVFLLLGSGEELIEHKLPSLSRHYDWESAESNVILSFSIYDWEPLRKQEQVVRTYGWEAASTYEPPRGPCGRRCIDCHAYQTVMWRTETMAVTKEAVFVLGSDGAPHDTEAFLERSGIRTFTEDFNALAHDGQEQLSRLYEQCSDSAAEGLREKWNIFYEECGVMMENEALNEAERDLLEERANYNTQWHREVPHEDDKNGWDGVDLPELWNAHVSATELVDEITKSTGGFDELREWSANRALIKLMMESLTPEKRAEVLASDRIPEVVEVNNDKLPMTHKQLTVMRMNTEDVEWPGQGEDRPNWSKESLMALMPEGGRSIESKTEEELKAELARCNAKLSEGSFDLNNLVMKVVAATQAVCVATDALTATKVAQNKRICDDTSVVIWERAVVQPNPSQNAHNDDAFKCLQVKQSRVIAGSLRIDSSSDEDLHPNRHADKITTMCAFQPDSYDMILLFTGAADEDIRCWDARSGDCLFTFTEHAQDITTLKVFGDQLFTASNKVISYDLPWLVSYGVQQPRDFYKTGRTARAVQRVPLNAMDFTARAVTMLGTSLQLCSFAFRPEVEFDTGVLTDITQAFQDFGPTLNPKP